MTTPDMISPAYHGAQALRAAADAMDADPEFRDPLRLKSDWLRRRANGLHPQSDPDGVELVRRIVDTVAMDPVAVEATSVARALTQTQFTFANENQLQAAILDALDAAGVKVIREVILSNGHGRVDLFTSRGVAVEVKIAGAWANVYRQLERYGKAPEVNHLILVTTKAEQARKLPRIIGGKPLTVVLLRDGFGVIC